MKNKNVDINYLLSYAKELQSKFRRLNNLVKHSGSIGAYHETILREFLKYFLSDKYGVKTGHIYYDKDTVSKQIDILIVDENYPVPYLFTSGDYVVTRPEPVICMIEVKTRVGEDDFSNAIKNIYEAKEVCLKTLKGNRTGIVFFYDSPKTESGWLEKKFNEKEKINLEEVPDDTFWPNLIFFFKKREVLLFDTSKKFSEDGKRYYYKLVKFNQDDGDNLSFKLGIFLKYVLDSAVIYETIFHKRELEVDTNLFIDTKNMKLGIDGFRVGETIYKRNI